ncbi:MAG: peptidoglycan DL-endopeptidase CwlO [Nocardioidaceae bacterium]|nr:peptidoglycan DL-endopeptidase CwlO [Nocardioidaceae bacterium]
MPAPTRLWLKLILGLMFLMGSHGTRFEPMRAFPLARRGLVIGVVLALASTTSARADDPSVAKLQVRLVESRQQLNSLYAQSAAASERLNGATYELAQAKRALSQQRDQVAGALKKLDVQKEVVADLTVEQLMSGSTTARVTTMLDGDGTQDLLDRASAYESTDEAMNARIDELNARQVVYRSAARRSEAAVAALGKAAAEQRSARAAIDDAISRAESAAASIRKERQSLLRQLADAKGVSVADVTRKQDRIDERLDEAGPDLPATDTPNQPAPNPTAPRPTTPQPTTPKPTTPPPADPPLASGSKVEAAISFAKAQLGEPYVWGGAGPSKWDCSGLTMRAWQAAGVNLPHYAGSQYSLTKKVPVGSIKRGDLLYWSNGGPGSIYHVAMYLGGGQMIQAPRPGRGVEIVSLSYWIKPDLASRPG